MRHTLTLDTLREMAFESGFNIIGVTDLEPPSAFPRYEEWLTSGYHAGMAYLENPETLPARREPSRFFPQARSILFLGMRYPVNRLEPLPAGLRGRVSSYAWGKDYHTVLPPSIQKLIDHLKSYTGADLPFRFCVDSSPVLEKPLAARAGLGWQGRNSCLINPLFGSFFFLAGVFSPLVIDSLPVPHPDRCGTCRRCVDACPTGCILPDRTIDAGRCISYLTIENKSVIPRELRPLLGDWLFGCDICQAVCPWNAKLNDTGIHPAFQTCNLDSMFPELDRITRLTTEEFRHIYKGSPILRAKRTGLLRNAAVVLGNQGDTSCLPVLKSLLFDEIEPIIRLHAAWAIGRLGSIKSREILSKAHKRETDNSVMEEIKIALDDAN